MLGKILKGKILKGKILKEISAHKMVIKFLSTTEQLEMGLYNV